jgi:regulator of protease activity HflC (stomatin/prohibitin superfamily)
MNVSGVVASVLGFFFLVFAVSSCHVVPAGHRGVKVTMGSVAEKEVEQGVEMKMPFFTSIHDISIQQQTEERTTDAFSKDLQTVKIKYAIMYKVPPQSVVPLYRDYRGDLFSSLIDNRAQESIKQIASHYNSEELVQSRDKVREGILTVLRSRIGDVINVVDFNLMNIDLSDQLEHAIEQKMVRQQESLAKNYELDKERKQGEITVVQAKAEAESVKIKGEALAKSPNVVDLEIVKKWDGKSPSTVVIGGGTESATGANVVLPLGTRPPLRVTQE